MNKREETKKKEGKKEEKGTERRRSKGGGREREKINNVFSVLKNNREMFPKKDFVCVCVCVCTLNACPDL